MGNFKSLFCKDDYTHKIQINTLLILILRSAGILCNLIIIPVTLHYLNKSNYGVWLTLTSIIGWISFMDVGLGNGMRNKIAESMESGNLSLAKEYVSTTYVLFGIIIGGLFIVFSLINPFINWREVLKANIEDGQLLILTYIIVFSFSIRLVLDLVGIVVIALHKPFIKALIDFFVNAMTLVIIYLLTLSNWKSLLMFGSVVSIVPVLILIISTIFIYRNASKYHFIRPSIKNFKCIHVISLFSIGIQFFIIQIAALVVFSTDNILITQLFSPTEVTNFNITYKYFGIIGLVFSIILMPYWSSFTSAFASGRINWIKSTFKKLILFWIIQCVLAFLFIVFCQKIYLFWLGREVSIPFKLNIWMGVYIVIFNWNNLFVYFLNGISKIRLQLYSSLLIGIINIPLSYYLANHTSLGVSSIIISNCICLLVCSIWAPVQCFKIINKTANGIWNQ